MPYSWHWHCMEVSGHFDISSALLWLKKPWYLLDRSLGAPRGDLNILKKSKISYHCRNCTLDYATLSLVHVPTEIYEFPFLHMYGTNFKWWKLITAVLSDSSSQNHLHPHNGDLVYLELELENADHHIGHSATTTKRHRVLPIFAYVKCSIKGTLTESTRVHNEICEYCMLLTLLSSAEIVCASYKGWIHSEWMYSRVSVFVVNSSWLNSHVHWNQFAV